MATTEKEWSAAAASTAQRRATVGTIETAVGGTFVVTGAGFLLAPQIGGLHRRTQYSIGALLAGTGVPLLTLGLHALFVKTPVEVAWDAYRVGKRGAATSGSLQLGLVPLVSGGRILASLTF